MKPGEHPEFYRLPPPPGRSRESTIVLDGRGNFTHEGEPIEHAGMRRAFASWLKRHPDDGRFILDNGYDWTYLTVEGDAAFVDAIRDEAGRPLLELFDGSVEALDPAALWTDEEGRLRTRLERGVWACFRPHAQTSLMPWLKQEGDRFGLEILGKFWPISQTAPGS